MNTVEDELEEHRTQQLIMRHLVLAIEKNQEFRKRLRTLYLRKSDAFNGFGIGLHTESVEPKTSEKLVYPFIEVSTNSPAQDAGLENGYRLVAVNDKFINRELRTFRDIVECLDNSYYDDESTKLTLLEPYMWPDFMDKPQMAIDLTTRTTKSASRSTSFNDSAARLITLVREDPK